MKRYLYIAICALAPAAATAQSAMEIYSINQQDLKGTARFMSMGGAFGALGGDLSTLSQNPGGIGVYRSNELGFTVDLDCARATIKSQGSSERHDQTNFDLDNIGGVATFKLGSKVMPNFNIGFTYSKTASFNRTYRGAIPQLHNSVSNYIAGISNAALALESDFTNPEIDPYNPGYGNYQAPWISILGFDSFMVTPETTYTDLPDGTTEEHAKWYGQWQDGTSGAGYLKVNEKGGIDNFNIALGGNISNVVFWGMDFDIVSAHFNRESYWNESLDNALVGGVDGIMKPTTANTSLYNYYNLSGTGFNYKLGVIVKPIQELRLGFAFHTPTWYNLDESFYGEVNYDYGAGPNFIQNGQNYNPSYAVTNGGLDGINSFNLRTPWRFIASAAGVIGSKFIISADYEWTSNQDMHVSDGSDDWDDENPYDYTNLDIKNYYKTSHNFRVGAEYRINGNWSARVGYSYAGSPVKAEVRNGEKRVDTSGTQLNYVFDNETNYVTCGLGYRYQAFYVDLAYVWRQQSSEFHAYPGDPSTPTIPSPTAGLTHTNNRILLSAGFKF